MVIVRSGYYNGFSRERLWRRIKSWHSHYNLFCQAKVPALRYLRINFIDSLEAKCSVTSVNRRLIFSLPWPNLAGTLAVTKRVPLFHFRSILGTDRTACGSGGAIRMQLVRT
jgi:hypothetical protein